MARLVLSLPHHAQPHPAVYLGVLRFDPHGPWGANSLSLKRVNPNPFSHGFTGGLSHVGAGGKGCPGEQLDDSWGCRDVPVDKFWETLLLSL